MRCRWQCSSVTDIDSAMLSYSLSIFLVSYFQEENQMYVEYVLMMDLQKWYCTNHQQWKNVVHVIHFASIVSNVMPRYLSRQGFKNQTRRLGRRVGRRLSLSQTKQSKNTHVKERNLNFAQDGTYLPCPVCQTETKNWNCHILYLAGDNVYNLFQKVSTEYTIVKNLKNGILCPNPKCGAGFESDIDYIGASIKCPECEFIRSGSIINQKLFVEEV